MADFCTDNTQQVEFDEKVVCGLWQCEALRASQKVNTIHILYYLMWCMGVCRRIENQMFLVCRAMTNVVAGKKQNMIWKLEIPEYDKIYMICVLSYFLCFGTGQLSLYPSGGWINIKMSSYQNRKSCCGDYKNPLHLDVVDRYLQRKGDKTIPNEAPPSLESFYPPWVAGIDLPQSWCCGFYVSFTYKHK